MTRNSPFPLKAGIRVLGVDDTPFYRDKTRKVPLVGVVYRGAEFMEGCLTTSVTQDGWNATEKIAAMVHGRFEDQIHIVMLQGITVAGFNIVDIEALHREVKRPILVVMRHKPDYGKIYAALENLTRPAARRRIIERAGSVEKFGILWIQRKGLEVDLIPQVLALTTARGNLPEALRVAHIIARGITRGESRGRA